jgi:glycosyltransferase involved in cell wall biosynthesis
MRILHVARRYWPAVGGIESFLRHHATELATEHDVTVLAQRIDDGPHDRLNDSLRPPPSFEPFDDQGVRVEPLRVPVPRRALMAPLVSHVTPGLRRYAYGRSRVPAAALVARATAPVIAEHAREADIVHMWAGDLLASAAVEGGRLAGVPTVITPFAHRDQWGYDPASVRAYRRATFVLALLHEEAGFYRELGVAAEALRVSGVCSPGVEPGGGEAIRRGHGIEGPLVLFLGARRPYKGFDLLLGAAPDVAAAVPGVTFAFAGPGPALENVPDGVRVIDAGLVPDDERAGWLEAADVLCLPSQAEIFPSSMLEAWSVGTPALTSDIPALRELIERSGGGATAPRERDSIGRVLSGLLSRPEELARMGEAGRAFWANGFTPERVARWHEDVYREAGQLLRTAPAAA